MLNLRSWRIVLILGLTLLSIALYVLHYFIFYDVNHIFIFMIGDLAFLPLYILVVTLGLHEIMRRREKSTLIKKLNIVVGTFYSEVGTDLLNFFAKFDPDSKRLGRKLLKGITWSEGDFSAIETELEDFEFSFELGSKNLRDLREFLIKERNFELILLENPALLEITTFSNLLLEIFHITEELEKITGLEELQEEDVKHLKADIKSTYILLVMEWLSYMKNLKDEHPYLFSLALRTNPFR